MPSTRFRFDRVVAVALLVGVVHAVTVWWVVRQQGHPIDPLQYVPGGVVGAAVGLVALAAVPVYVLGRTGLVSPLVGVAASALRAGVLTATTPPPEFSTLGGHVVVSGPRYVDAYVDAWYVWLFAALLLGAAEYVLRVDRAWLPDPRSNRLDAWFRQGDRAARRTAGVAGAAHALVFLVLAADWNYFVPDGYLPAPWYLGLATLGWTVFGLVALAGAPTYLLVRYRIVAPTVALAWLVARTGWIQNLPLPDDPLPLYFLAWVVFLAVLLAVGGVEYGLRRAGGRLGVTA